MLNKNISLVYEIYRPQQHKQTFCGPHLDLRKDIKTVG